ncbi:hypothetical protein [Aquimarina celericrescens]|uniref:Lipoprotein n=1 Tax=Aquimarina celericrescens TaxID=1964542 RepID=A0ABW5B0D5_9FLAO|nr:hypothetical protein [Aquimarina celericrescens]
MKRKYTYITLGVVVFTGIIFLFNRESTQNFHKKEIQTDDLLSFKKTDVKNLKLFVLNDFKGDPDKISDNDFIMISEKSTSEIIKNTMASLDWKKFNIVQLKNENNDIYVGGSLERGFHSGYRNGDFTISKKNPLTSIEEMTKILLAFFKGENTWVDGYKDK